MNDNENLHRLRQAAIVSGLLKQDLLDVTCKLAEALRTVASCGPDNVCEPCRVKAAEALTDFQELMDAKETS